MKQQCTNSVLIVKNSQTAKMTIGEPIVTCLHRLRRIHKVRVRVRRIHKALAMHMLFVNAYLDLTSVRACLCSVCF